MSTATATVAGPVGLSCLAREAGADRDRASEWADRGLLGVPVHKIRGGVRVVLAEHADAAREKLVELNRALRTLRPAKGPAA